MTLDKIFQKREEAAASLAQVSYSLEEGGWGAVADQEYRHRPVIAPGGYRCPYSPGPRCRRDGPPYSPALCRF